MFNSPPARINTLRHFMAAITAPVIILCIRCTRDFYAYATQETSLFILQFWVNWLGNVEVDAFRRLCHFPFNSYIRVSQKKVLIWSTGLSMSLDWSLWSDRCCRRIKYHYQHDLDLVVHHDRRHAPYFFFPVFTPDSLLLTILAESGHLHIIFHPASPFVFHC